MENTLIKMKPKVLCALKASIAHWRRMATGTPRKAEAPVTSQCRLCDLFIGSPNWCEGCPVNAKTGPNCVGTHYQAAAIAYHAIGIDSLQFKSAAKRELKFLESLLPKKRKSRN